MRKRIGDINHGTDKYTSKELQEVVRKRNRRLNYAFSAMDGQVRIIGDPETPALIYNDTIVISAYVKNFDLIFTDKPKGGNQIAKFKLLHNFKFERKEVLSLIQRAEHRTVYRVQFLKSSLFLAGWNFTDRDNRTGRYPVFARLNPKVYFSEEKALEIIEDLAEIHYECFIV